MPSSCSHLEVEDSLREQLKQFTQGTGINLRVRVDQEMCQVKVKDWLQKLSFGTKMSGLIFFSVLLVAIFAAIYDASATTENKSKIFFVTVAVDNFNQNYVFSIR